MTEQCPFEASNHRVVGLGRCERAKTTQLLVPGNLNFTLPTSNGESRASHQWHHSPATSRLMAWQGRWGGEQGLYWTPDQSALGLALPRRAPHLVPFQGPIEPWQGRRDGGAGPAGRSPEKDEKGSPWPMRCNQPGFSLRPSSSLFKSRFHVCTRGVDHRGDLKTTPHSFFAQILDNFSISFSLIWNSTIRKWYSGFPQPCWLHFPPLFSLRRPFKLRTWRVRLPVRQTSQRFAVWSRWAFH